LVDEFSGPDSARLKEAVCASGDFNGRIFVLDRGDNSVKIFGINGQLGGRWDDVGIPYRIKIADSLAYILDRVGGTIKRYALDGRFVDDAIIPSLFDDITAFKPDGDHIWVADMGGTRLSRVILHGKLEEIKQDYCFMDVNFYFDKITAIEDHGLNCILVTDMGANYLIQLGYHIYL
jgi:hypothetical protein